MNKEKNNSGNNKIKSSRGRVTFFVLILSFFLIVGTVSFTGIITPDRDFSENENRVLASMPALTLQSLADGSFMKKAETYLADQFPFRDTAIRFKSLVDRALGKTEENGAYVGKNGFLFDKPSAPDKTKITDVILSVNRFAERNTDIDVSFVLVPNSTFIYADNLPDYVSLPDQKAQIKAFYGRLSDEITPVNTVKPLLHASSEHQVFYKTDHHWTTRGAFSVFSEIARVLEIDATEADFEFFTVSDSFKGTLSSKVTSSPSADSVEICIPKDNSVRFYIDFYGEKEKSSTFFYKDKLETKNHYEVFLGGNYGKLTVTTSLEGGRKLLIIKDSFANCLIPLLTPYFSKITVLDPRYMTEGISEVLEGDNYTDALFLYNVNTLLQDTSIRDVL